MCLPSESHRVWISASNGNKRHREWKLRKKRASKPNHSKLQSFFYSFLSSQWRLKFWWRESKPESELKMFWSREEVKAGKRREIGMKKRKGGICLFNFLTLLLNSLMVFSSYDFPCFYFLTVSALFRPKKQKIISKHV